MRGNHPELTKLVHDNLWIVISFVFARPRIDKVMAARIKGTWLPLDKNVREMAEVRADRALLEMATQLRALDDRFKLAEWQKTREHPWPLGEVTQKNGEVEALWFRDFTNKVLHAASYEWDLSKDEDPKIIVHPIDGERWARAEVNVIALMMFVGELSF
jgi:hypothetical protein